MQNLQWVLDVFRKRDEDDAANESASKREETKCQNTQQEAFIHSLLVCRFMPVVEIWRSDYLRFRPFSALTVETRYSGTTSTTKSSITEIDD